MGLWTPEHAKTLPPAVLAMLILCIILRLTLGKKEKRIRMIPMQVLSVILLVLEVGKQALSLYRGYDLYHIPLHFCSLFLFVFPAMSFCRGKHENLVTGVSAGLCAATAALTLIYPSLIYGSGNIDAYFTDYFSFHTVTFHNLVIFACMLIISLQLHSPEKKGEPKAICLFLAVFCTVAAIASQLLQTNYAGFFQCNVPFFEDLRLQMQPILGYAVTQIIYVVALMAVHMVFVLAFYWVYRGLLKVFAFRKAPAVAEK